MNKEYGHQKGETQGWASAYSVFPTPIPINELLLAACEVTDLHFYSFTSCSGNVLVIARRPIEEARSQLNDGDTFSQSSAEAELICWGRNEKCPDARILNAITILTGIRFFEIDTSSDLNVTILVGRDVAEQHYDLENFAQGLYEQAGYTNPA